jgi:hypothetical protein
MLLVRGPAQQGSTTRAVLKYRPRAEEDPGLTVTVYGRRRASVAFGGPGS